MNPMPWLRRQVISRKLKPIETQLQGYRRLVASAGPVMAAYDAALAVKRDELHARIDPLYRRATPEVLSRFLIHFSAIGAHMTEGVPDWFRRAGAACVSKGFAEAGADLLAHADEEDGHSLWFKNDLALMVDWHRRRFGESLSAAAVLAEARLAPCVNQYIALHNRVIESESPIAWLSLKYEIELLSLDLGPRFIGQCVEALGFGILKGLSFVSQHAVADVDHIRDDIGQLTTTLDQHADRLAAMVDAGETAIECYARYFETAFARAEGRVARPGPAAPGRILQNS